MRRKMFSLIAVAAVTMLTLAGCGSNRDSSGSVTGDADDVLATAQAVGITNCAQCHTNYNQAWLEGRHANANGSPSLHYVDPSRFSCANCHNLLGDSENMPLAYPGETRRDVVSCESCHGGGQYHSGVGPIPYPRPGVEQCAQCHAEVDPDTGEYVDLRSRNGHSPAATTAVTGYLVSGHADSPRDRSTRSDAIGCNRCHSDEGAKLYRDLKTIAAIEHATRGALPLGAENLTPIQCRTCHDTHKVGGDSLLMDATLDGDAVVASAQYNTCTHCHADNAALDYHAGHFDSAGLLDRQITDTHYDDPETKYTPDGSVDNIIEGYVIRNNADTACSDCHNVHSADNTINEDWAKSRHGGNLLEAKMAAAEEFPDDIDAVVAAGRVDGEGHGWSWTHYDWDAANRQPCQRCHTSTGAANYLSAPADYVAANNDFSHMNPGQNEMLYCWGCHTNVASGELRAPGAIEVSFSNGATASYPDAAGSNACIACHSGREIGDSITNSIGDFSNLSFINSHYLAAGGTVFGKTGYHYEGLDYEVRANDRHTNIGFGADVATGDVNFDAVSDDYQNGPCATCHFSSADGSHTLSPFTKHETEGLVLNAVCVVCHTSRGAGDAANTWYGVDFTADDLEAGVNPPHKGRYIAALEALRIVLADNGIAYSSNYPYFSTKDWTVAYGVNAAKDVMGAAFNYNLLAHDPAGVAHNRQYTRRLIYDSIDFMDDGAINDSVLDTLNALGDDVVYKTGAISYLTFTR